MNIEIGMEEQRRYRVLKKQVYRDKEYSMVPIRMEDRYLIMKWRNEQIYHLRQENPLTKEEQDNYFDNVVRNLFEQGKPEQVLFSLLKNNECIGYGGLVHINWKDMNAEISFIMNTRLEGEGFEYYWSVFLKLIEEAAFKEASLHKIYTYAFDIRSKLYEILEKAGFYKEAILKNHCCIKGEFKNVIIHAKISNKPYLRKATEKDLEKTFDWVNNDKIRQYSLNKHKITYKEHENWFFDKITNNNFIYLILQKDEREIGSIRFDIENEEKAKINYLIEPEEFGRGYGTMILELSEEYLKINYKNIKEIYGIVFNENIASIKIFNKLGYKEKLIDNLTICFNKIIA